MDAKARQHALDIAAELRRCPCGFDARHVVMHRAGCQEGYRPSRGTATRKAGADIIAILLEGLENEEDMVARTLSAADRAIELAQEATTMLAAVRDLAQKRKDEELLRLLGEETT